MLCRICKNSDTLLVGHYAPYLDYKTDVWDCNHCGSRFVSRDPNIYEKLHSSNISTYSGHTKLAFQVKDWFSQKKFDILSDFLRKNPKNRYIIDEIESCTGIKKILEIGCGKGYLTSYFISKGYEILGVDISPFAVNWAKEAFGNFFASADAAVIEQKKPYDAICHVGTIGCVESPLEMTSNLLKLLKPGGMLIFNAPNLKICEKYDDIWIKGTQPPDLVTLFMPSIWEKYFSDQADVSIIVNNMTLNQSAEFYTHTLLKKLGSFQTKKYLFPPSELSADSSQNKSKNVLTYYSKKIIYNLVKLACKIRVIPALPAKFGVYVKMVKKYES